MVMPSSTKLRLLIADDNDLFIEALIYQLSELLGNKIEVIDKVHDGLEAIDKVRINNYDYIFMDINMPKLDGISATKYINSNFRFTTIVAMSFHKEFDFIKDMLEAGARSYILKEELDEAALIKLFE
jgi:DNA-binding NarL/FixJ family response regulator